MEQSGTEASRPWRYRVRWPESGFVALREWSREREVTGDGVFVPLVDPLSVVEAEWRWAEDGAEWQSAAPHKYATPSCRFVVEVKQKADFRKDPVLRVTASVRGLPCCYDMALPSRVLAVDGPETHSCIGLGWLNTPAQHLREAGEFAHECERYSVVNCEPSEGAFVPVERAEPGKLECKGTVMVRTGSMSAEEKARLLEWVKTQG